MKKRDFLDMLLKFAKTSGGYRNVMDMFANDASHHDHLLFALLQTKMIEVEILIARLTK